MIKESMAEKLNEQINLELCTAHVYQQMAAWAEHHGYNGSAKFLLAQAYEEREHMQKLFDYVLATGHLAQLGDITNISTDFLSLDAIFKMAYEGEQKVTKKIHELAHEALNTQDYSTFEFIQWFIVEQREEESLFKSILDKFDLLKDDANAHYYVDRELASIIRAK